jgi:hypothetical protein
MSKHERLKQRSAIVGTRHTRKLRRYSDSFYEIFNFFLQSYRKGILIFGGDIVEVQYDINAYHATEVFRRFEDGQYKLIKITSCHPNIVKSVIVAKKAWGLWCTSWSEGIAECNFTKEEILKTFEDAKIKIPEKFLIEFDNRIKFTKQRRLEKYLNNEVQ